MQYAVQSKSLDIIACAKMSAMQLGEWFHFDLFGRSGQSQQVNTSLALIAATFTTAKSNQCCMMRHAGPGAGDTLTKSGRPTSVLQDTSNAWVKSPLAAEVVALTQQWRPM